MKFKIKNLKFLSGFTLIEMMVTLGIITALSTMVLVYSRKSETVTSLIREGDHMVFELQRAQNQAMLVLQKDSDIGREVCGWGIYIDKELYEADIPQDKFLLFADLCETGQSSGNGVYDNDEEVETISLLKGIEIFNSNISSITFIPPEPQIKFDPDLSDGINAIIKIHLKNNIQTSYVIRVSDIGQIYKELEEI